MTIRQISLNNFRNLKSTTLDLHHKLNVIYGSNASGKTSLLEALHVICQGQSFRTHHLKQCIDSRQSSFLIFAIFDDYKAGISRSSTKTTIRINGETINRISSLASMSPVRIIDSDIFTIVVGSPAAKREFMDWCLFHVEHSYHKLWSEYHHGLKQRNALLKQKTNLSQLDYWDKYLDEQNAKIFKLRSSYIKIFNELLKDEFSDFIKELKFELNYKPGWDESFSLREILSTQRVKDLKYGFTRYGIHRDDLYLSCAGLPAQNILSRGQVKKLSILLMLTNILFIQKQTDKNVILLIDDIQSELDTDSANYLLSKLEKESIQLFVSTINRPDHLFATYEDYKMFHVEHGIIKAVKHA